MEQMTSSNTKKKWISFGTLMNCPILCGQYKKEACKG